VETNRTQRIFGGIEMLIRDYLPSNCSTSGLMGLTKQIVDTLMESLPANSRMIDISAHIKIAGGGTLPYLQREAGEALIAAIAEKGEKPELVHALRVLPQQYAVFYWYTHGRKCGVKLAASPSASPHERAIAIDIRDNAEWRTILKKHNWIWRGTDDPPHFNFRGPSDPDFNREAISAFQKLWNRHNPGDQIDVDGSYGTETRKRLEASPIEGF
jgi:hypothetical protein